MAIQFIYYLFKEFGKLTFVKGDWIGNIWKGIKAIGMAIYDTLLEPFVVIGKWIWKHLAGHSPSEIGIGILKGIQDIEGMLIKSLLFPYITAWKLIQKIPFVSHLFGHKNVGIEANPGVVPSIHMEKSQQNINSKKSSDTSNTINDMNETLSKRIDMVVDAINSLRTDFKNGVITANVFLDSQKLDSAIGRRLNYTGTLT